MSLKKEACVCGGAGGKGICQSAFCHCDKIPETNNLHKENVCLGSQLQSFISWVIGSVALGPWRGSTSWQKCVVDKNCLLHVARK
jgi:hypothetical protein